MLAEISLLCKNGFMEKFFNNHEHQTSGQELTEILTSEYFLQTLFDAEFEVNEYISNNIEFSRAVAYVEAYLGDEIGLVNPVEKRCTVIGVAHLGNKYAIREDTSEPDEEPDNIELAAYQNLDLEGFAFRKIPGEFTYSPMLMFAEPDENLDDTQPQKEPKKYYYFKVTDVASVRLGQENQKDVLTRLDIEATYDIMQVIGDKEVHVDADIFYEIYCEAGQKPALHKVDIADLEPGAMSRLPFGVARGCNFIENFLDGERNEPIEKLIEDEPCLVIENEDDEIPFYLVPLSQINDIVAF